MPRRAAAMVYRRVRAHIDYEELVALGNIGLAEAAARFDPSRGVPFSAFAWYRVKGAMIDGLRRATNLPRAVWQELVALRAAADYLENGGERAVAATKRGGRRLTRAEALAAIKERLAAIKTIYMTSMEAMQEQTGFEPADEAPRPVEGIALARAGKLLRAAIERLPERERALMKKHYWEGKDLQEAAVELNISKSWASRLHAQAIARVRELMDGPRPDE